MSSLIALTVAYSLARPPALSPRRVPPSASVSSAVSSSVGVRKQNTRRHALSGGVLLPSEMPQSARADNKFGVYLTASSMARTTFRDETLASVLAVNGNAFVFDVKGSFVYFHTGAERANDLGLVKPLYDLPAIVAEAKAKGLYTIGRFIALKDPIFSAKEPSAQIRHPVTKTSVGTMWVDGSQAATLEYNRQILRTLAASGIDEINLDYIRFPTEYAPSQVGLIGREKADKVEAFIKMARETINEVRPQTKLGISTYAILGWNYPVNLEALGQDFVRFAPLLDVISPMAYPNSFAQNEYYYPGKNPRSRMYYLVWRTLDGYKKLLAPEHHYKLRPWIQGYSASAKDIREEIDAVYDAGLCGYTVWSAGNKYGETFAAMKGMKEIPERCR